MPDTFQTVATYLARVAPGLLLGIALLLFTERQPKLRIAIYLSLFVLLRDAMTPLGLWSFGTAGFFWIRLSADPLFLLLFATACLGLSLAIYFLDRANRPLFRWTRGNPLHGIAAALFGTLLVVAPLAFVYQSVAIDLRGGPVPTHLLPALLIFALLGNLLEESLFRGYVYGLLEQQMTPLRAAIGSGVVFAFCHIYLATTVTSVGYPLLVFTLWEGIIAGIVGSKYGVLPSTLTHGGAIFLLASGLL